jgi:LETM1 and EF-hand domain-containing protein 1
MKRVRAGDPVAPSDLLKFAKLFNDELTLDNLERVQLISLCRFVGIQPFGTDAFLRARLRAHLQSIRTDDRDIQEEGLDSLTEDELRQACRARGMRAPFGEGAAAFMREQLDEWLDWSLNRSLPSSLLLLSRAFTVTAPIGKAPVTDVSSLRETLSSLPDEAVEDVELFATASDGDKTAAYERKLDLLEREEELIKEEEEAAVATELPVTAGRATAKELAATAAAAAVVREAAASSLMDILDESESQEEKATREAAAKQARMRQVLHALAALATSSGVTTEREAFMELVQKEIDRLHSVMGSRSVGMVFTRGHLEVDRARIEQALGQKRLEERVTGILKRVEKELDDADTKIGDRLRVLDLDNDGIVSQEELRSAMSFLRQQMGEEDLRSMLEALAAEAPASGAQGGGIDVAKLMELALHQSPRDED